MAITAADLAPYIDQSAYAGYNTVPPSYANQNLPSYNIPRNSGGNNFSGINSAASAFNMSPMPSWDDPMGLGSIINMFGGGGGGFSPYVDANGNYVWTNPNNRNPVPVANVPGAPLRPNRAYRDAASQAQALNDLYPYIANTVRQQQIPNALMDLQTAQLTSPGNAQLMTQLYNQFGPQLNAIGNEINRRNAMAQAGTDLSVLQGPGQQLINQAYQAAQTFDKPYYDTRAAGASAVQNLINSIDLTGGLSPTERDEITKGLARQNFQSGTFGAPSQSQTVGNAMQYGQAGYQRQQQAKSNLSDAISKASAFLPASKSGVDVFQVATGRSSMPNPGNGLFPGINQSNNGGNFGLAGSILGGLNQDTMNNNNIQAQKKDWIDKFVQITQGISNIGNSVGGIAGGLLGG